MTVLLCRCIESGAPARIEVIRDALVQRGEAVYVGGALCRTGIGPALEATGSKGPLVVGCCRAEEHEHRFMDTMRKSGLDPFALRLVPAAGAGSTDTAIRMLTAAAARMRLYGGVRPEHLKPKLGRTGGELSRRGFLTFPRLRWEVVPAVDRSRCRAGERGCRRCEEACGAEAIAADRGQMAIQKEKCTGCGACVDFCPADAIHHPRHTSAELTREIEALLERRSDDPGAPRAVLYACEESDLARGDYFLRGGALPDGVLPVAVPCIGMLSSFHFAYPVLRGAASAGVLSCHDGRCPKRAALERMDGDRQLAVALLAELGIEGARLRWLDGGLRSDLDHELTSFHEGLRPVGSPAPLAGLDGALEVEGRPLIALLERLDVPGLRLRDLPAIPHGMIRADTGRPCTLCGVCAERCPAEALTLLDGSGPRELRFTYRECVACGECVRSCPERALSLRRELDASELARRRVTVLVAETRGSCSDCGSAFLNEALASRLRKNLPALEAEFLSRLCPGCRMRNALRSVAPPSTVQVTAREEEIEAPCPSR
jgi:ferredoxin